MNTPDQTSPRPLFPALMGGRGLDMVKIVAAICMIVDHTGYIVTGESLLTYLVGRIAFPLFCFAAAASIVRLRDDSVHLYRQAGLLLLFALLTEPVSQLTREGYQVINVLFTLALGVAVAPVMLALPRLVRIAVYALAVLAMADLGAWEFGMAGMLLPAAMAGALLGRATDTMAVLVLAGVANFGGYGQLDVVRVDLMMLTALFATLVPFAVLHAMNAYYASRAAGGRILSRYALHLFYPGHMLVLWLIALLVH